METLFGGKTAYVDDLVTRSGDQSKGCGAALFQWLAAQAREMGCDSPQLDSGVQRFAVHRFYLRERMEITCHHFAFWLGPPAG